MSERPGLPLLQSHGALHPEALYVERAADQTLYQALRAGELCYVLAPRQIGKSSLRVRTARRLTAEGARCAELDLTRIGGSADHDPIATWYFSLLANLAEELALPDPRAFWLAHEGRLPADRLIHYLRQVVLQEIAGQVVIFLDEIDYLRSLPLSRDELFAALRAVYSERARDATYRRLTFCLLGVAAPSELIQDPEITPFNIGRPIRLKDFSRAELVAFADLLSPLGWDVVSWLDEIYRWTHGHPYMTQRLCETLLDEPRSDLGPAEQVERSVRALFLRRGRSADPNLSYAEKRLDSEANRSRKAELLALYHRLLAQEIVDADGEDPLQLELQLCGLVATYDQAGERRLRVRNLIFARVFGPEWLRGKEAQRELMQAQRRWQASGRAASALLRGVELDRGQSFVAQHLRQVTAEEHEFLLLSLAGARREAEEQRLATEAAAERELRRRAEAEAASLRELNDQLERALAAAESARREANQARSEAVLARERAEAAALNEKSLRAAELAAQSDTLPQALVLGLQAARPDLLRDTFTPAHWTGLLQAAVGSVVSHALRGHEGAVRRAAISSDGQWLVSASGDGTVQLWELRSGARQAVLIPAHEGAWSVAISPDSTQVIAASQSGKAQVLDLRSGRTLHHFQAHDADVFAAAYSPDGRCIATASADHTARIWDAATGVLLRTLTGHTADVTDVAFAPDGRLLVTASADRTARVWSAASGELQLTLYGHTDQVWSAAFSSSGNLVATASWDQTARIWNDSGQAIAVLQGHTDSLWRAAFSGDDRFLVTASDDKSARLWLVASGQTILVLRGHTGAVLSASFAPDQKSVLTSSADGALRLWDTSTGTAARQVFMHDAPVWSVATAADGSRVVTGCADYQVRIWEVGTGHHAPLLLSGHTARIWSTVFSPDGTLVATSSEDLSVRLWDAASGQCLFQLPPHNPGPTAVAFSGDGTRVVTAGWDQTARIWSVRDGQLLRVLSGHTDRVWTCAFAAKTGRVVTGGWDKSARIWDGDTGQCLLTLRGHAEEVMCAAFSPSGKLVVTTSSDSTARIWSATTGESLVILRGHLGDVMCAAFSPDGLRVVTAGWDGAVRVWALTGRLLLTLHLNTTGVLWAAFTPDGQGVVTGSTNGVAAIYPLRHQEFYDHGLRVLRFFGPVPEVAAEEIGALLLDLTHEEIKKDSLITVDTRPLLGKEGRVLQFLYFEGATVQTLLSEIFGTFNGKMKPFSYGQKWVIFDPLTKETFSAIGSAWFRDKGSAEDPRTLREAGLRPGMQLEVVRKAE